MIRLIGHVAISIACCAALTAAYAATVTYPQRPVRILVGAAPGGTIDALARLIAQPLSQKWGSSVVVDNRPGASNALSASLVAHAVPDGYTLLMVNNNHTTPSEAKLDYDPLKSFAPIVMIAISGQILIAHPSLGVSTVKELIALAKAKPGQLNFGSPGTGSPNFFSMKLLMDATGIDIVHITYKGGAPALSALLSNEVQLNSASVTVALGLIKTGRVKALAVTTTTRNPLLPDVPTMAEAANLPGYSSVTWTGIVAPAATPPEIVRKIRDDIVEAVKLPELQKTFATQAFSAPAENTPEQFGAYMASEVAAWAKMRKADSTKK